MDSGTPSRHTASLRIIATTDVHGALLDYDYFADEEVATIGLSRVATLIEDARSEVRNHLLVDNGDLIQGTPLVDLVVEKGLQDDEVHPMVAALNLLGCEVATIGNHEFDYGIPFLNRALVGAEFPFVCANMDIADVPPWTILDRRLRADDGAELDIRIGVTGVLPPQVLQWNAEHLAGKMTAREMADAVADVVPQMRAGGADIVLVLAHTGLRDSFEIRAEENQIETLAAISGIDAMIGGHSHRVFPADGEDGRISGVPVVLAGSSGNHLGLVDLSLRHEDGLWHVENGTAHVRPTTKAAAPDPRIQALAEPVHRATLEHVKRPLGRTVAPINSFFALVGEGSCMTVVNAAQTDWATRVLAGTDWAELPVVGAAAPFKAGGWPGPRHYIDLPTGDLSVRSVADLYGYPNVAVALLADGRMMRGWLERSASIFLSLKTDGGEQLLFDDGVAGFNFDVLSDFTWVIDLSDDEGQPRVRDVRHRGRPVDDDAQFVLVTNSYRAGGGGAFPGADAATRLAASDKPMREILADYVEREKTIDPRAPRQWRFAPVTGATALFDTGPGSSRYEVFEGAELVGETEKGFLRYRMPL